MDNERTTLDITQAATYLGITEDAVRKRIKRGKLQSKTVDGRLRVVLDIAKTEQTTVEEMSNTVEDKLSNEEMTLLREELAKVKAEAATAKEELNQAKIQVAETRARVSEMELRIQDLREHNANLTIALDQAQQLHQTLQQKLALPAPEEHRSWFQRWFGKR